MLKVGIVGLPNVGKSSLFNALTAAGAPSENYPFCTVEPNVGTVEVPDVRLDRIHQLAESKTRVPTVIQFVDIAGLVEGASEGEGLGNKFLGNIREVDAIAHVLRCFDDEDITHVLGNVDPARDRDIVETELALSDLDTVQRRLDKVNKKAKSGEKDAIREQAVLEKALAALEARIGALNPGAPRFRAVMGEIAPDMLFDTGLYDPKTKTVDVQRWLREESYTAEDNDHGHDHGHDHHDHAHNVNRHDASISAFCITRDEPIDWEAFVAWVRILIGQHGEKLLRIKGILNIAGRDKPIAVHGVQHMFHDPAELADWPDDDRRSRLVFITRDLDQSVIEEKLDSLSEQAAALDG